jgi:hypothetical protein
MLEILHSLWSSLCGVTSNRLKCDVLQSSLISGVEFNTSMFVFVSQSKHTH